MLRQLKMSSLNIPCYERSVEDLKNEILYEMCRNHFEHKDDDAIYAKTMLIGRTYAVALERGKSSDNEKFRNDEFYIKKVIPTLKNSEIDSKINSLKSAKLKCGLGYITPVLDVYSYLLNITKDLDRGTKHSFCSKYLHFHLPELFFIYDSRAKKAINKQNNSHYPELKSHFSMSVACFRRILSRYKDKPEFEYAEFFCKCLIFREELFKMTNEWFTPREIDKILLEY